MKQRADVWLTVRGMAESREKAQALIMAGQVYVGEKKVLKASEQVEEDAPLHVRGDGLPRGGSLPRGGTVPCGGCARGRRARGGGAFW